MNRYIQEDGGVGGEGISLYLFGLQYFVPFRHDNLYLGLQYFVPIMQAFAG